MNNMSSYCGLSDARMSASDTDLAVFLNHSSFPEMLFFSRSFKNSFQAKFLNVFWQLWTCCDLFWKSYDKFSPKKWCKRFRTKLFSKNIKWNSFNKVTCMYDVCTQVGKTSLRCNWNFKIFARKWIKTLEYVI